MKKVFILALVLFLASASMIWADQTSTSVIVKGNVPEGYTGGDDKPVYDNEGMKLVVAVVTSDSTGISAPTEYPGNDSSISEDSTSGATISGVNIIHDAAATGPESMYIAFGAYGNVSEKNNPTSKITVESKGWTKDGSTPSSVVNTLTLTASAEPNSVSGALFTGAATSGDSKSITVSTNSEATGKDRIVSVDNAILVGYSMVNWEVASDSIPATGDYTGTIQITFDAQP